MFLKCLEQSLGTDSTMFLKVKKKITNNNLNIDLDNSVIELFHILIIPDSY